MVQFNLKRFSNVAKWSLRNDRSYFVRNFLQTLVILTLVFLFFTTVVEFNGSKGNYTPCALVAMVMLMAIVIMGPSLMFYSMTGKHDMQSLLMVPASNLEKYLVRYGYWVVTLPIGLLAFFGADLIQYVVNWLLGHDYTMLVTSKVIESDFSNLKSLKFLNTVIMSFLWFQSVFALGGTFFRSHKYAWILTILVLIVFGMLLVWVMPESTSVDEHTSTFDIVIGDVITLAWVIVNYWLSYRCFCRTQNIGKFVNI